MLRHAPPRLKHAGQTCCDFRPTTGNPLPLKRCTGARSTQPSLLKSKACPCPWACMACSIRGARGKRWHIPHGVHRFTAALGTGSGGRCNSAFCSRRQREAGRGRTGPPLQTDACISLSQWRGGSWTTLFFRVRGTTFYIIFIYFYLSASLSLSLLSPLTPLTRGQRNARKRKIRWASKGGILYIYILVYGLSAFIETKLNFLFLHGPQCASGNLHFIVSTAEGRILVSGQLYRTCCVWTWGSDPAPFRS